MKITKYIIISALIVSINVSSKDNYVSISGLEKITLDFNNLKIEKGHIGSNFIECRNEDLKVCYYSSEFNMLIAFPNSKEKYKRYKYKNIDIYIKNIFEASFFNFKKLLYVVETTKAGEILNSTCISTNEYVFDKEGVLLGMTLHKSKCEKDLIYEGKRIEFHPITYLLESSNKSKE